MPVSAVARSSTFVSSSSDLERGSKGPLVANLQRLLASAGFSPGPIDGDFGAQTEAALRRFQAAKGLQVDGIAGPISFGALRRAEQASRPAATGPELSNGDRGPSVARLQQQLARAGFDPGGVDGVFGDQTEAALMQFQRSAGLKVDGVSGPRTQAALTSGNTFEPAPVKPTRAGTSSELRRRILDVAQGEVGNTERSNRNDGEILKYPRAFGRGSEAWCADFVSWVVTQAGGKMNDPYCPSIKNRLVASGDWKGKSNPQPGDLVLFDWDGDRVADHIGLVKSVNANGSITTIEGNTGGPGGREGVWERTRYMGSILGFGNPPG